MRKMRNRNTSRIEAALHISYKKNYLLCKLLTLFIVSFVNKYFIEG